ncbi:MAG: hypothetical protein EXR07_19060 [Acetobacteraceae bacterium]|nr:hypothetical protein [Acetobacteraceae bacterium]
MHSKSLTSAALAGLLGFWASDARAADLFNLNLNVTTPTTANASASFSTITNLANSLQNQNLINLTSAYTITSAATGILNVRGLTATASYTTGSPVLTFVVPSAGLNVSFNGGTRDASQILFKDFLLKNGGGIATKLLQALVAKSPIDPVAGNPNSMQNTSARSDFGIGTGIGIGGFNAPTSGGGPRAMSPGQSNFASMGRFLGNGGDFISAQSAAGPSGLSGVLIGQSNLASTGGDVGISMSGGYTSTMVSLPIRYIIPFSDPRYAVTLDLPISYVNTAGASAYSGSFGVSLRIPVTENWYLTPSVRAGASASIDLGAGAIQYSGGIASRYDIFVSDLRVTIGNGVTFAKTAALQVGSISVNYDLTNVVFNNGVQVEGSLPYQVFGQPTSWQAYIVDTTITGSAVYLNHYDEIGINVGTRAGQNKQNWDSLRVGAAVLVGSRYNAFKLQFSARF